MGVAEEEEDEAVGKSDVWIVGLDADNDDADDDDGDDRILL